MAGAVGLCRAARHALRPLSDLPALAVLVGLLSLLGPVAAAAGLVPEVAGVGGATFVTLALMNLAPHGHHPGAAADRGIRDQAICLSPIAGDHELASTPRCLSTIALGTPACR